MADPLHLTRRQLDNARQHAQGAVHILGLLRHDQGPEILIIIGDDQPGAIDDQPARRGDEPHRDAIIVGQHLIAAALDDLQKIHPPDQQRDHTGLKPAQHQRAARQRAVALHVAAFDGHRVSPQAACGGRESG